MAKYIILDTETTGTEQEDRIIQLGYIILDGKNVEVHNEFCSADTEIKFEAMAVHGITPEMVEGKPACVDTTAYKRLLELNQRDNYMIIHNAPFDLSMLQKEGFENSMKLIDTLRVSRHLLEDSPKHQLQYFRYQMGIYRYEEMEAKSLNIEIKAHDAIGDVLVLKLFLSKLKELIVEKYKGENPVEKMVELTKQPILIKKFKFGKYKDKTIQEVAQSDPSYLRWMLSSMDNLDDDLRYSIKYYLNS